MTWISILMNNSNLQEKSNIIVILAQELHAIIGLITAVKNILYWPEDSAEKKIFWILSSSINSNLHL